MILFSFPQYEYYATNLRKLPGWQRGRFSADRYQNGELFIQVKTGVKGKQCVILAETAPPDGNLLTLLLLAHTLRKEGAEKIVALIPYLGYARHDREKPGLDLATRWLGELLKNAGVSEVVTIDVHSPMDANLFPIPIRSLSSAKVLAKAIADVPVDETTLVAPDEGAIDNCEAVRDALGKKIDIAFATKKRTGARVAWSKVRGTVKDTIVMVDDILDTGQTMLACAKNLHKQDITVLVSHGIFSGAAWRDLRSLGVKHIYCTDTVPSSKKIVSKNVTVLSAGNVLTEYFKNVAYKK